MKQANGTGSIIYDAVRKKFRAMFTTPAGRRISKRFNTKKAAQEWIASNITKRATGSYVEPSSITVGSWLLTYLHDYKALTIAPKTMDLYALLALKCEPLADIRLQAVTAPLIQRFYTELLKTNSVAMVRKVHAFLHAACTKAQYLGMLAANPMDVVDPPKATVREKIETFTPDEIAKVLTAAKQYVDGRYYAFILTAFQTGARLGELIALEWDCVDTDKNELIIRRNLTVSRTAGQQIGTPKTKSGIRAIAVPPSIISALKVSQRHSRVIHIHGPVFTTRTGTHFQPRNIMRMWKQLLQKADVPYRNFHVIRHTHATELLAAGVPIADVSRRIGHARISHTLDLYGHAIPRMDSQIAAKAELIFSPKTK